MHKVSEIITMPVLSLYEGELIGQVTKICFDKKLKKMTTLILSCEGDLTYELPSKNIYKLGKNAVTIKNLACLNLILEDEKQDSFVLPSNTKVYTIQGEYKGKVEEINVNEKFDVVDIMLDNSNFLDTQKLCSSGKNTIIVYDKDTKINVSRFKNFNIPKLLKIKKTQEVNIQPYPPTIEKVPLEIPATNSCTNNSKFLIGRISTKDILLDEKKYLIKANSTITERILSLACTHNKMKELMIASKQK